MEVKVRPDEISEILKKQLADFVTFSQEYEIGTVLQVGDGLALTWCELGGVAVVANVAARGPHRPALQGLSDRIERLRGCLGKQARQG